MGVKTKGKKRGEEEEEEVSMEGIASIALLPSGSISGHFIHLPNSTCYGLQGTVDCGRYRKDKLDISIIVLDASRSFKTGPVSQSHFHASQKFTETDTPVQIEEPRTLLHFIFQFFGVPDSQALWTSRNLMATSELSCERECSRGEDYRLIKLAIIDYSSKREQEVVVECRGHDAARFQNVEHAHGWEEDVVGVIQEKHGKQNISVFFECETLKSDNAAEEHMKKYMPNLVGLDAVVNIGKMSISGINLEADDESSGETSEV